MSIELKTTQLFGGAIEAKIPADFLDVSNIRQVPDNQEVFVSRTGFSSLTIDLCDRVTDQPDDQSALLYHFHDLVDEADTYVVREQNANVTLPHFSDVPVLSLLAVVKPPPQQANGRTDVKSPTYTIILFTLIRLEKQSTDLEVILNLPNIPNLQEITTEREVLDSIDLKTLPAVISGSEVVNEALNSLLIKDWGLFASGG